MTRSRATRIAVVVVAAAAYSWVAAGRRPFTLAQEVLVALPALAILAVALARPSWSGKTGTKRGSAVPWLVLVVLGTTWELIALFSSPREDHPTLSSFADDAMGTHAGRAAMFLLWLALGWCLVTRRRAGQP